LLRIFNQWKSASSADFHVSSCRFSVIFLKTRAVETAGMVTCPLDAAGSGDTLSEARKRANKKRNDKNMIKNTTAFSRSFRKAVRQRFICPAPPHKAHRAEKTGEFFICFISAHDAVCKIFSKNSAPKEWTESK